MLWVTQVLGPPGVFVILKVAAMPGDCPCIAAIVTTKFAAKSMEGLFNRLARAGIEDELVGQREVPLEHGIDAAGDGVE
jgi:hypothetical protein